MTSIIVTILIEVHHPVTSHSFVYISSPKIMDTVVSATGAAGDSSDQLGVSS